MLGSFLGGFNNAAFLSSLCFSTAALFAWSAFCFSVRTFLGFGFGFALALVERSGFALVVLLAAFWAAGFFAAAVPVAELAEVLAVVVVFLFDAVARPVCALGLPGRCTGVSVA